MLRLIGFRASEAEVEIRGADPARGDRDCCRSALMRVEMQRLAQGFGVRRQRPVQVEVERIVAGLAIDVVDVDMHLGAVADIEEARQRRRDDDRVPHSDVGLGGADLVPAPGDSGEPHRAVEARQVERQRRLALVVELDDPGEERERRLGWQIAFEIAALIAAGLNGPGHALHAVDQHAPEVADLDRQLALAEEIRARVRCPVAGKVEDAEVDRRDGDMRLLSRREACDRDRDLERLARLRECWRAEGDVELAPLGADGEPGEPDRAAGHALRLDVERPVSQRDRIGARTPIGPDRERYDVVAGDEVHIDEALDRVADQRHRRLANIGRIDAELRLVSRRVSRLVEGDDDIVRRVGARRSRPADVERDARLLAIKRLDVEPVSAPSDGRLELRRHVGADVDDAARDPLRRLDRLVAPAPVAVEPLIVVGQLIERPGRALAGDARPVGGNGDRFERRRVAGADRGIEVLLHPDDGALRPHRQRQRAFDRAAAGLGDVDDQLRLERPRGRRVGQIDRKLGMTLRVGCHLVGELGLDGGEVVVGEARDIAGKAGERPARDRLQADRPGDVEPACRRAVEEARLEREPNGLAGRDVRPFGLEGEIEPLGDVILEQEAGLADRIALRVGVGLYGPLARSRPWQQRHGEGASAETLVGDCRAPEFDAVGALHDQSQRQAAAGDALCVAQERNGEHRLARAVDAALRVEEGIEARGRVAPGDPAIGEIEGVLRQIEEIVVAVQRRDDDPWGRAALAPSESGIEIRPPVGAGRLDRQHLVVAGDELQFDASERSGGTERLDQRMDAVVARDGGEAEVGDDHPLSRKLRGFRLVRVRGLFLPGPRGDEIDAGIELADCLHDREIGHNVFVERVRHVHRAAPHLDAVLVGDLLGARRVDGL